MLCEQHEDAEETPATLASKDEAEEDGARDEETPDTLASKDDEGAAASRDACDSTSLPDGPVMDSQRCDAAIKILFLCVFRKMSLLGSIYSLTLPLPLWITAGNESSGVELVVRGTFRIELTKSFWAKYRSSQIAQGKSKLW